MKGLYILPILVFLLASCQPAPPEKGPLRVSEINPRYFTDGTGKAVYLTGAHTWNNLVDMHAAEAADTFDFQAYLDFTESHHLNFMRLWAWELTNWNTSGNREEEPQVLLVEPHPWARTGPGTALDGKPKFDLREFNPDYFRRLRQRVEAARDRNIYLAIMLFEGWGLQFSPEAYAHHPFHPRNNVNDLGLDTASERRLEIHELLHDKVLAVQEAYVKRVIETLQDLDNVLYEISNENHPPSTEWQYHMVRLVKDHEKQLGVRHPVGMTFQYRGGSNQALFDSPADWISPNPEGGYRDNPPLAGGNKVIITDTDHLWGIGGNRAWVWKSFLRGMNPLFMDPYDGKVLEGSAYAKNLDAEMIRENLGYTMVFARKLDLLHMVPDSTTSSSKYCLTNPGKAYLTYLPEGNAVQLDLTEATGSLRVEWFDPATGAKADGSPVQGGDTVTLSSPFPTGEALLYAFADE